MNRGLFGFGKGGISHEFVSNSDAADADDISHFITGTTGEGSGAAGGGSVGVIRTTTLTATRKKRIRWLTPKKGSDIIQIEVWDGVDWSPLSQGQVLTTTRTCAIFPFVDPGGAGTVYGMGRIGIDKMHDDIVFGRYCMTDFAAALIEWSTTNFTVGTQWRVHKISFG